MDSAAGRWNTLSILALAAACAAHDPELDRGWARGPSLPEPIQENHAAALHGRIYTAGGFHFGSLVSAAVFRLDSPTGRWKRVANLPAPRHHMPLAVAGDSLYAVGGLSPDGFTAVSTVWLYDERNDRWMERAPLPEPRGASAVGVVDGRIIVVGGFGLKLRLLDSIAIYDPATNAWRHGAPIPTRRDHLAAAVVDGKVYAVGGRPLSADRNFDVVEMYDPATDTWTKRTHMPTARGGLAAVALGNRIYTYGGETTTSVFAEHEVYDPAADAWTSAWQDLRDRRRPDVGVGADRRGRGVHAVARQATAEGEAHFPGTTRR